MSNDSNRQHDTLETQLPADASKGEPRTETRSINDRETREIRIRGRSKD